jgi:hypothetical protein
LIRRRILNDSNVIDEITNNPDIPDIKKRHFSNNDIPLLTIAAKALSRDSIRINSDSSDDSDTGALTGFQSILQANKNGHIDDYVVQKVRSESINSYLSDPTSVPTDSFPGSDTTHSPESQGDNYMINEKIENNEGHIDSNKSDESANDVSNIKENTNNITDSELTDISNSSKERTKMKKLTRTSVVNFDVLTEDDVLLLNSEKSSSNNDKNNENDKSDKVPTTDVNTPRPSDKVKFDIKFFFPFF